MEKVMQGINGTKKIVGTAVFSALSFVVSLLEFPIFSATSFLKLDFSLTFILLSGFIFGFVSGVCASAVKELLRFLIFSTTGGIGELANFIITVFFILVPTLVYQFKKGLPTVIITLIIGSLIACVLGVLSNRLVLLPLFLGKDGAKELFNSVWYLILLFNAIKTVSISLLSIILYKRVSKFIRNI